MDIAVGRRIEVESERVGQPPRRGTVRAVLKADPLRIEVEWEDGRRSIFEPEAGSLRVLEERA